MTENTESNISNTTTHRVSGLRVGMWAVVAVLFAFTMYNLVIAVGDYYRDLPPPRTVTIHIEGDNKYLWAIGPREFDDPESEWFDLTGSPLPLKNFQYGIGKDRIPSIDDPIFVDRNDERLTALWKEQGVTDINELEVIGYEHNGVARAYPIPLLDGHELVNDTVGGKPVTVGW